MEYLEQIKDYWNSRADGYSDKNKQELDSQEKEIWQERLSTYLPKGERLTCLDMGCGPGFLGILLAEMGHQVTLYDYSEEMLVQAAQNAKQAGVSVTLQQGDAQKPPYPAATFDVIVSRNLVWNLENPEQAYDQWLQMLKIGGRLIIFDGNHYLYQFDKLYEAQKHCPNYNDPHTPTYMKGVDPCVMEEIAKHLPLSRKERPYWDVEFFLKKRIKNVTAQPVWLDFQGVQGEHQQIITAFTVCVEK